MGVVWVIVMNIVLNLNSVIKNICIPTKNDSRDQSVSLFANYIL